MLIVLLHVALCLAPQAKVLAARNNVRCPFERALAVALNQLPQVWTVVDPEGAWSAEAVDRHKAAVPLTLDTISHVSRGICMLDPTQLLGVGGGLR